MCSEKLCAPRRDIGVRTQTTEGVQEESGLSLHMCPRSTMTNEASDQVLTYSRLPAVCDALVSSWHCIAWHVA